MVQPYIESFFQAEQAARAGDIKMRQRNMVNLAYYAARDAHKGLILSRINLVVGLINMVLLLLRFIEL